MNKTAYRTCYWALTLVTAGATLAAELPKPDQQAIFDKMNKVLVTVEYKSQMTFMGQSDDIEGRVIGLSVGHDGLVIFDGSGLGGSNFGIEAFGAPRVDKPKIVKVTDYRDMSFDAEFIGVDDYSEIAFCRLPDSARGQLETTAFQSADLKLGTPIHVFWMLPKGYNPRFQMTESAITAVINKPEPYYLTGELPPEFLMAPVVTETGQLVGVVTNVENSDNRIAQSALSGSSLGEPVVGVMPVERLNGLLAKPPAPGITKRGWLGIALQALDPDIASFWKVTVPGGIIVSDVTAGSPADQAGLKPGDFLVELNGKPIEIKQDAGLAVFQKTVSDMGAGAELRLKVIRPLDDSVATSDAVVVLGEMPVAAADAPKYEDKDFDVTMRDLVFSDYNMLNLDKDKTKGVIVDKLETGGWAAVGGIFPGDIIIKINDRAVTSVAEAKSIFAEFAGNRPKDVVFMVQRDNKTKFVNVKTHWK